MNVLVAEDEPLAAERLTSLLQECDPSIVVAGSVDSVEGLTELYSGGNNYDLLLLDIQLADGKSFEAFSKVNIITPIIFTTAYDQYALQAFKHFSIDYLLKPIQKKELERALQKFNQMAVRKPVGSEELKLLKEYLQKNSRNYRERFLIKAGNKLQFKLTQEAAYFFAEGKAAYLVTKKENRKYLIDHTLEELESSLDPLRFFRISRKFIVNIESIAEVKGLISSRLELKLNQPCDHELSVSRDRAVDLKHWLDR